MGRGGGLVLVRVEDGTMRRGNVETSGWAEGAECGVA